MEVQWEETREETLNNFKMDKFVRAHFANGNTLEFTEESLKGPMLAKSKEIDKMVFNQRRNAPYYKYS